MAAKGSGSRPSPPPSVHKIDENRRNMMENEFPEYQEQSDNLELGPDYIYFSQETNALDYLIRCAEFIERVVHGDDPRLWKWVVIALHGALYGFAISAARGTNNIAITCGGKGKRLVSLWKALKLCQEREHMSMLTNSQPLKLSPPQKKAIDFLTPYWRNEFEHFVPSGHIFRLVGIPEAVSEVLDVIRFLALETHTFIDLSGMQQQAIETTVERAKAVLRASPLFGRRPPSP